jgi:hypothetical protein
VTIRSALYLTYAYASGAIEPARGGATSEFLAEIGCEVVAIHGKEVVGGPLESLHGLIRLIFASDTSKDALPLE